MRSIETTPSMFPRRAILVAVVTVALAPGLRAQEPDAPLQELLRNRIEATGLPALLSTDGERVYSIQALPLFYEKRVFRPAWIRNRRPSAAAWQLLESVRAADLEGLRPADYHLAALERLLGPAGPPARSSLTDVQLVDLDLLLTDAFLIYAAHLVSGRVDPMSLHAEWIASRRERDLVAHLEAALDRGAIRGALAELLPDPPAYRHLRDALARYRAVAAAGGWPTVPSVPKLTPGDSGPVIAALRARLALSDGAAANGGELFDSQLEEAVRRFQTRHGLEVDGIVGPATLAALNVPVESRIQQIQVNLERWRWLPEHLGDEYIIVNIASFTLDVVRGDRAALSMRVVVGRPYRRTPVFSDRMTYLVFSPYWHVPRNLAVQDILPQIKRDPGYLQRQGMRVFRGAGTEEVDPATIDWSTITAANFDFRLRQDPGPSNALGQVKFMFPNRFNVYLHDTPSRTLFERASRDFSSGCIRIEKPLELAELVLSADPSWTRERIRAATGRDVEQTVRLTKPFNVHLLYWTAWASDDGSVHFRRDLYERDTPVLTALFEPPTRR